MAWEQFEKPELDGRIQLIAGYLANKIEGKTIVDLDCGTAPLLDWLPAEWHYYYGNDTNVDFVLRAKDKAMPRTGIWDIPDNEVLVDLHRLGITPDILLSLGYGARLNEHESQTLDETIKDIVHKHRPEIVIYEYWTGLLNWEKNGLHSLFDVLKWHDYVDTYRWILHPAHPLIEYGERKIMIWEALPNGTNRYLDLD